MGRDNKHGWYEEHEKFVAMAARSLSSVLLVGDPLVNGLARYHRVWSKYFEPLHELNFGVYKLPLYIVGLIILTVTTQLK